jgi:hypothetical protein
MIAGGNEMNSVKVIHGELNSSYNQVGGSS